MPSKLPESARLTYARQLADEALTLVPGVERLAEIVVELRTDDLYRLLGFDTWEQFCKGYLGISRWTANRLIAGPKPKSITAGQDVAAVHPAPTVESDALNIPAASTEALAKSGSGETDGDAASASRTKPLPGQTSGGAELQPPAGPTGERPPSPRSAPPGPPDDVPGSPDPAFQRPLNPPELADRPPSDRQLAARVFAAMREVDPTDAGPVTTPEEATFLRQWAQRTLDAWKAVYVPPAPAEKPQRRQGTITRPGLSTAKLVQAGSTGPVPVPLPKYDLRPAPTRAKRHADDCSCLSCVAPKAAAK